MKKYIILAIAIFALITFTACSGTSGTNDTTTEKTEAHTVYDDGFGELEDGSVASAENTSDKPSETTTDTTEKNTESTSNSESGGGLSVEEFDGGDSDDFNSIF